MRGARPGPGLPRAACFAPMTAGLAALLLTACQAMAPAEPPASVLTGTETGAIRFQSRSPIDFAGMIDGSAPITVVSGTFHVPEAARADAPVPAIIISHTSGGIQRDREPRFAKELVKLGFASLVIDSYGSRGVRDTLRDQSRVSSQAMMADAFAALRLLATDPRIDGDRIGLLGFSKGGIVALYSAFERIRTWYAQGDERFAAHAAFYPFCGTVPDDRRFTGSPVGMFLGELDDYTPAALCKDLQSLVDPDNRILKATVYPGAHHAFDSPRPPRRADFFNPATCRFIIGNDGVTGLAGSRTPLSNESQRRAALRKCGSFGVTVGGDAAARRQSLEDLKTFFREALS